MDSLQLRQSIHQQLEQLSGDRLRLVANFITDLVSQEEPKQQATAGTTPSSSFRPPSSQSLLRHQETWAGDDFEECLKTVYETRSDIQP